MFTIKNIKTQQIIIKQNTIIFPNLSNSSPVSQKNNDRVYTRNKTCFLLSQISRSL